MKNEVQTMRLIDAPVGLLEFDGTVILKTEYMTRRADGSVVPDCYIVESGEYFCGGVETAEELKNLEVTQMSLDSYGERHFPDLTKMVPLTLEQLREMDGQPVWICRIEDKTGWWAIVRIGREKATTDYGGYFLLSDYGITWFAYAYPPAHIDREEWISVEERLPEDEKGVLAYYGFDRGDGDFGMRFMGTLSYFAHDPNPHWQHESTGLTVTHWMPLPAPPDRRPPEGEEDA